MMGYYMENIVGKTERRYVYHYKSVMNNGYFLSFSAKQIFPTRLIARIILNRMLLDRIVGSVKIKRKIT